MTHYRNLSGQSGVHSYEISESSIVIRFIDGSTYLYDGIRPGKDHVEKMKKLAASGEGLATYINKFVRDNFASRLK